MEIVVKHGETSFSMKYTAEEEEGTNEATFYIPLPCRYRCGSCRLPLSSSSLLTHGNGTAGITRL